MKTRRAQDAERSRIVCGVGINDADYAVIRQETVNGKRQVTECPFYRAWKNMLNRCYSKRPGRSRAIYSGCTVCPEWHRFSTFRKWMIGQDWQDKQLDKDILVENNKIYSPDTCAFVSRELNNFLTHSAKPSVGVSWNAGRHKYQAYCNNPLTGKPDFLGWFDNSRNAHKAWRKRKNELAWQWADLEPDARLAAALRSRFSGQDIQEAA